MSNIMDRESWLSCWVKADTWNILHKEHLSFSPLQPWSPTTASTQYLQLIAASIINENSSQEWTMHDFEEI